MAEKGHSISSPSPVGVKLKAELKKRGISQKDFAKYIDMSPSHLSDIVRGERPLPLKTAFLLQIQLDIPVNEWMDLQVRHDIEKEIGIDKEEMKASEELAAYDEIVSVKTLLKKARIRCKDNKQKLFSLRGLYNLPASNVLKKDTEILQSGYFKKSTKTGLDARMIATWVILARNSVKEQALTTQFEDTTLHELASKLAEVFHSNENTIIRTHDLLAQYGIKFSIVERLDHASIDGYSFVDGDIPAIVVTKRYDRIDNFAFAVLHETYHVYKHLNSKRHQMISIVDYDAESTDEEEANDFASRTLVNQKYWSDAPTVQLNKPWEIQRKYTSWAEEHNLNKWIVLGQISHITGMYKFITDDSRKIH